MTDHKLAQRIAAVVPEPGRPSTSTVASTAGGALAVVGLWFVETYVTHTPLPGAVASAITTLVVIAAGYFFSGGRSRDTI